MKALLSSFFGLCLIFSIQACGVQHTSGNQNLKGTSTTQIEERIKLGVTTKKEIESWFGPPSSMRKAKSGDSWGYNMSSSETRVRPETFLPYIGGLVGGTDTKLEHRWLWIDFDKNGVVETYNFTSGDDSMRT